MTRIRSGISELDKMLRGGFMEGDAVMVAGGAGTGKTVLALQYLVGGATQFGEGGVYVTFEQLPDQIYRDARNFGWNLRKMEDENRLRVVCTSPSLLLEADGLEQVLDEPIREINARRIVVDSLNHLEMLVPEGELRKEAYRLLMYFKTKGLSSVVTWEASQVGGQGFTVTETGLGFLVDCIILLRFVEIESSIRKALTILKMRGSDHDRQLREFEITSQGVKVVAPFTQYEGILTGSPRRMAEYRFAEAFEEAARKKRGK